MEKQFGAVLTVMQMLYQSIMVKNKLGQKMKL